MKIFVWLKVFAILCAMFILVKWSIQSLKTIINLIKTVNFFLLLMISNTNDYDLTIYSTKGDGITTFSSKVCKLTAELHFSKLPL